MNFECKKYIEDTILNKIVDIEVLSNKIIENKKMKDKYGRLLVRIKVDNNDLAKEMIRLGYGKSYSGGSKI